MNVLGVVVSSNLSFTEHINYCISKSAQTCYALRMLRSRQLTGEPLWEVGRATLLAQLTYASPAWWGFLDAAAKQRLQIVVNRAKRNGFLSPTTEQFSQIGELADNALFESVLNNNNHVLFKLLPPKKVPVYDLRQRVHNLVIPKIDDTLLKRNFIYKMTFKDIY